MPFPAKIQPIDSHTTECLARPTVKSRLKRLFERQFLKSFATEREPHCDTDAWKGDPSSVCLAEMVQNFIEETNEKHVGPVKCGRNRCNCFTGNNSDRSEDEIESSSEKIEKLKSLIQCPSVCERNLLADTAKIMDKNKTCKHKDEAWRRFVSDGLLALGYDASICKSRWQRTSSYPAGKYEYIDVIMEGDRVLLDIDFRSEFEIARPTKTYRSIVQSLPHIFVGNPDRLLKIIWIVSDAANQSLKKNGMHVPPWRKVEYIKAKWLSPYTRARQTISVKDFCGRSEIIQALARPSELIDGERDSMDENELDPVFALSVSSGEEGKSSVIKEERGLPLRKPKSSSSFGKISTGFASVVED